MGPAGLGGDDVAPVGVDFADSAPAFVIAGPPGSGRSTALASLAVSLLSSGTRLVVLTPRESPLRAPEGHPGVRLLASRAPTQAEFTAALGTGGEPRVVLVDDADPLTLPDIEPDLRALVESGRERGIGLAAAATGDTMSGAMGWLGALKRQRRGVLLDPQSLMEGDILGARLTHAQLRDRKPGPALTVDPRSGELIHVQIPETRLD